MAVDDQCAGGVGNGYVDQADGLLFGAASGASDSGNCYGVGGSGAGSRANRHGFGGLWADGAELLERFGGDAEQGGFERVGVRDEAAEEVIRTAGRRTETRAEHTAGAAFCNCNGGLLFA